MKIVHVIENLDPAWGGVPMVASRVAAAQTLAGHEVSVVCHAPVSEGGEGPLLDPLPEGGRFEVAHVERAGGLSALLFPGKMAGRIRGHLEGADFVHLHGVWDPILLGASVAARGLGIGTCVTPHGMLDPWSLSQKRLKKRVAMALGYRKMLEGVRFIQMMNPTEHELVAPLGLKSRFEVVPNGIFIEEIEPLPEPGAFRETLRVLGDRPYVLFLSRLHYKKGLDLLAHAYKRVHASFPEVQLVVAGPEDEAAGPFREQIEAYGLSGSVHLTGPIYGRRKIAAIRDAACFCLPSRQEGFSIAITEAMASGAAVVITGACHFEDVGEVEAGVVTTLEPESIAAGLCRVLGDADEARAMGERGRRLILERYTWPAIADRLVTLYSS